MHDAPETAPRPARRHGIHATVVAAVIALTIGVSGLFMGMRQASRAAGERIVEHRTTAPVADNGAGDETGIPRAVEYSRLREGTLRPNTDWENSLAKLAQPPRELARFAQLSADEQELVRLRRTARRQYDGAPPIAPHPLDQMSATTCMECHGRPTTISGIAVPQMSHRFQSNCLQCHATNAVADQTPAMARAGLGAGSSNLLPPFLPGGP